MWVALFSHSGSELADVCEKLGVWPSVIFCDKVRTEWDPRMIGKVTIRDHKDTMNALKYLNQSNPSNTIATLHGYMRIIPPKAILPEMYNVHPGDIVLYPELRGMDPQKKALELGLRSTGVVIHQVDEGVDTGEIIDHRIHFIDKDETEESLINELRDTAVDMWVDLLEEKQARFALL